ncbi:uncharacterized protein LOC127877242 [Dreissena polymorpha]|uniref:uncharacterized protein LOC127877242 n=1 Tax=Dreissena polymorpha TaxID=45954 RepID=UPI002265163E|nr:uncharacterized protein LOC127877242 [Dreissena polymorpha]
MSFKGKMRLVHEHSVDEDRTGGFSRQEQDTGTRSEFDYDLDVDKFKLLAARLNNASKQLSKIHPEMIKKQTRQNSSQNYTSKRLGRYQETYQSEIREAEDASMAITNLIHRDAPETGKLQRGQAFFRSEIKKEKKPKPSQSLLIKQRPITPTLHNGSIYKQTFRERISQEIHVFTKHIN